MLFGFIVLVLIAAPIIAAGAAADKWIWRCIGWLWGVFVGMIIVEQAFISYFVDPSVLSQDDLFRDYISRNTDIGIQEAPTGLESTNCERVSTHLVYEFAICSIGLGSDSEGLEHYLLRVLMPAGYLEFGTKDDPRRVLWDSVIAYRFDETGQILFDRLND